MTDDVPGLLGDTAAAMSTDPDPFVRAVGVLLGHGAIAARLNDPGDYTEFRAAVDIAHAYAARTRYLSRRPG